MGFIFKLFCLQDKKVSLGYGADEMIVDCAYQGYQCNTARLVKFKVQFDLFYLSTLEN